MHHKQNTFNCLYMHIFTSGVLIIFIVLSFPYSMLNTGWLGTRKVCPEWMDNVLLSQRWTNRTSSWFHPIVTHSLNCYPRKRCIATLLYLFCLWVFFLFFFVANFCTTFVLFRNFLWKIMEKYIYKVEPNHFRIYPLWCKMIFFLNHYELISITQRRFFFQYENKY